MAQKIVVDPVTRIEGHLKIEVEVDGGKVVDARSTGTLFRGFELIIQGKNPLDAQQLMQRICGVCPIAHATAATFALDDAFGLTPPTNGRLIRNLIFAANFIQSHILHFYHLAALDYVKGPDVAPFTPRYEGDYRLPKAVNDAAVEHYLQALEMRKKAHEMLAIWGGRMPHVVGIVPGGSTEHVDAQKIVDYKSRLAELTGFIENVYIPDVLAVADVYKDWFEIGAGCKNYLSYGGLPTKDGSMATRENMFFKPGVYINGSFDRFDHTKVYEDVKHSWFNDDTGGKRPTEAVITPDPDKADAYSWLKAPRYNGNVMEVGPLARAWINQDPFIVGLGEKAFSVMGRHAARALEAKAVAKAAAEWMLQLEPGKPTCVPHEIPEQAEGMGLTEAPRGALGHWIKISGKKTEVYNAVVPTTWNCGPRDEKGQPGPVEQALIGTPVKDPSNPVELVRIVRAFDPCLGCAIHLVTPDQKINQFQVY